MNFSPYRTALLSLLALITTACGQKGPLFIAPDDGMETRTRQQTPAPKQTQQPQIQPSPF